MSRAFVVSSLSLAACFAVPALASPYQMENLGRGVTALRTSSTQSYISWRMLGTDSSSVAFNVYRSSNGAAAVKLNSSPLASSTNFVDTTANFSQSNAYTVRPVVGGVEQSASAAFTLPANASVQSYLNVPLQIPAGGSTPDGGTYVYSAGDASVGDLDGDGEYEFVVKWDPSNAKDNSQSGYTGNVILDAYKANGTRLWRINLGKNIRAGAHYTQFIVYDLDGDGRAEVACKTADGSVSGTGQVIGSSTADYRNASGYVLSGPEFLTLFNGQTGAVLTTTNFDPPRGDVGTWGDTYGNRVDRFLAGVAYLDGSRPSLIMCRGYYTKTYIVAWDWRSGALTQRWKFFADNNTPYAGQGNHQLSIADVDADGRHEVVYGAMVVDDNGVGKHTTGNGHGDALHVSDLDPARSGLEIFTIQERVDQEGCYLRNANSGTTYWAKPTTSGGSEGPGRGAAADIDPRYPGAEYWVAGGGITGVFNNAGTVVSSVVPSSCNFFVWWDTDLSRELLNSNVISKWDHLASTTNVLFTADGAASNNGTKATPAISGDILGDWREEVVLRASDSTALRIYMSTSVATNRFYTFLHDAQYRVALAWQNVAYNQPPHPSFFVGTGMSAQPAASIYLAGASTGTTYQAENAVLTSATVETTNGGYNGASYVNLPTTGGAIEFRNVNGGTGGAKTIKIRNALGVTTSRTGRLVVNGVAQNITFAPTGAWTTWQLHSVTVTLSSGTSNTIRLESTGQDLANIDELQVP